MVWYLVLPLIHWMNVIKHSLHCSLIFDMMLLEMEKKWQMKGFVNGGKSENIFQKSREWRFLLCQDNTAVWKTAIAGQTTALETKLTTLKLVFHLSDMQRYEGNAAMKPQSIIVVVASCRNHIRFINSLLTNLLHLKKFRIASR